MDVFQEQRVVLQKNPHLIFQSSTCTPYQLRREGITPSSKMAKGLKHDIGILRALN